MSKATKIFLTTVIIIPLFVFSVTSYCAYVLKKDVDEISDMKESINDKMSVYEITNVVVDNEEADILMNKWEEESQKWGLFINHEEIHQIDYAIAEYVCEVKNGEYDAALITSARIIRAFKAIKQQDTPNIWNII